ncbi:hypothetical protein FGIG_07008 [Fasciola gigantica]|uniref:Uncharacterized protein n=1 Tax=Fasciola gigantica TaxID=46835 RepID=A0A504Y7Q0_FASGI|nr:hypothetical protein FGIG_07008 [Fasciola gigantica]
MVTRRELQLPSDPRLPTAAPETLYASSFIRRMHASLFRAYELACRHLQSAQRRQVLRSPPNDTRFIPETVSGCWIMCLPKESP